MRRSGTRSNPVSRGESPIPPEGSLPAGTRISVAWMDGWYNAEVKGYRLELAKGERSVLKHQLLYDDGETQWSDLTEIEYMSEDSEST